MLTESWFVGPWPTSGHILTLAVPSCVRWGGPELGWDHDQQAVTSWCWLYQAVWGGAVQNWAGIMTNKRSHPDAGCTKLCEVWRSRTGLLALWALVQGANSAGLLVDCLINVPAATHMVCRDSCMCCHTGIEVAAEACYLTHMVLTPGQPVLAQTLTHQMPSRVATKHYLLSPWSHWIEARREQSLCFPPSRQVPSHKATSGVKGQVLDITCQPCVTPKVIYEGEKDGCKGKYRYRNIVSALVFSVLHMLFQGFYWWSVCHSLHMKSTQ